EMWPLVEELVDGALTATLDEVGAAIKLLVERAHVVAEGAGATPVAAALAGRARHASPRCVRRRPIPRYRTKLASNLPLPWPRARRGRPNVGALAIRA